MITDQFKTSNLIRKVTCKMHLITFFSNLIDPYKATYFNCKLFYFSDIFSIFKCCLQTAMSFPHLLQCAQLQFSLQCKLISSAK